MDSPFDIKNELGTRFQLAIDLLIESARYAEQTKCDPWEFAVAFDELQRLGLFENDLRLLAKTGIVEHADEATRSGCKNREFQKIEHLSFTRRTCFILSVTGSSFAHKICASGLESGTVYSIPIWDAEARELHFAGSLVKRFKWPAPNQEAILAAFEEERWPSHIADPIPPHPDQDSRRRLNDTVKALNRHQLKRLLCFHCDGTGEGVVWERVARANSRRRSPR